MEPKRKNLLTGSEDSLEMSRNVNNPAVEEGNEQAECVDRDMNIRHSPSDRKDE